MVYDITKAARQKDLNIAMRDAEIAAEERQIELERRKAETREQELNATVRKQAEADRFAAEQKADAALYTRQKESEAVKVEAAAQAEAIKLKGAAEGDAIAKKGKGEAEGIDAQAEAYNKMNNQYILLQQYIAILPDIAKAIAGPLNNVDSITMYGEGNTSKLVGDTTKTIAQIDSAFQDSMGIDIKTILGSMIGGAVAGKTAASAADDTVDTQADAPTE